MIKKEEMEEEGKSYGNSKGDAEGALGRIELAARSGNSDNLRSVDEVIGDARVLRRGERRRRREGGRKGRIG